MPKLHTSVTINPIVPKLHPSATISPIVPKLHISVTISPIMPEMHVSVTTSQNMSKWHVFAATSCNKPTAPKSINSPATYSKDPSFATILSRYCSDDVALIRRACLCRYKYPHTIAGLGGGGTQSRYFYSIIPTPNLIVRGTWPSTNSSVDISYSCGGAHWRSGPNYHVARP
ncbi:hypothetical protein GW17_00017594 [Ensete ventricosum]|nr:hypothetical protein GW17_00017594 [Ensete ventricosum]